MKDNESITLSSTNGVNVASISTGTYTIGMYSDKKIIDVQVKEITIEISYRESPNFTYCGYYNSTPPDRVWKEIYGLKDGRMTLLKVVQGKHNQAQHIPESFEFDEDQE
jgi:hypothetical protein